MFIDNVLDFVTSLKAIREALGDKPEAAEAQKLIHQIRKNCCHATANRKEGKPIGRCPDCLKRFH